MARATPFVGVIVVALCSLCVVVSCVDIAAILFIGFNGMLRTGELFQLRRRELSFIDGSLVIRLIADLLRQKLDSGW